MSNEPLVLEEFQALAVLHPVHVVQSAAEVETGTFGCSEVLPLLDHVLLLGLFEEVRRQAVPIQSVRVLRGLVVIEGRLDVEIAERLITTGRS